MSAVNVDVSISPQTARDLVFNWSAWASSQHDTAEGVWDADCGNLSVEIVQDGKTVQVLHPSAWEVLWPRWLEQQGKAQNNSLLTSQEAAVTFKYVDRLENEDNLVSKPEFNVAFNLAATELAMFPFCVSLHERFWNSTQAWVATAGPEQGPLDRSRWSKIWTSYSPPFEFSKPSSSASFHYLDVDANGLVSEPEFAELFGHCHNTPTPSVSTTFALSTGTSTPSTGSSTRSTTITNTQSTSSGLSYTSSTTSSASPMTTSLALHHQNCCYEVSAECLSCIAGITVQELCSRDSMSLTPGCQGAPAKSVQAAPGSPHANAQLSTTLPPHYAEVSDGANAARCPFPGVAFSPLLPGFKESQEDGIAGCQARCRQSMGCGFFTFWRSTKLCKLHPITAKCTSAPEAIAGPPRCVARFEAHIASVDFGQLSELQLNNLHASLPDALAQHWEVASSKVQDVEGLPNAVTLLAGSLLVEGKVSLPAGTAVSDIAQKSDHGKNLQLRQKVSELLLNMNVPYAVEPGATDFQAGFPLRMAIEADSDCFVEHTEYFSEEQEKVVANTARDCQQDCSTSEVCAVFTFFAKDRNCVLTGGNFSAAANEEALSGPAKCPAIAMARSAADLPGQLVAESEAALETVEKVPVMYLALAGLVFLGLLVCGIMHCCRSKSKPKGKKAQKWHNQALYLPVAEEDEDAAAREVRSRTPTASSGINSGAQSASPGTPPWSSSPKEAFSFHGPDVLSWRQPV